MKRLFPLRRHTEFRVFSQLAGRGVLLQLILLASGPLVARLLGPEGRGELALTMVMGMLYARALMGGIGVAVSHAVAEADASARSVVGAHMARWLTYGIGAALVSAGTAYVLFTQSGSDSALGLSFAAGGIAAITSLNQLLTAMLRGQGDVWGITVIPLAMITTYVISVLVCWTFFPDTPTLAIALIYGACQMLSASLAWRRIPRPEATDQSADRRSLAYLARRSWATAVNTLGLGLDQVVVMLLLGAQSLGLYVVAVSITNVPAMALRPAAGLLMPRLVAAQPAERAAMTRRWLGAAAGLVVLLIAGLQVVIGPVIRLLFGPEFVDATTTARIMIVAWGFLAYRLLLTSVLQARGLAGRASAVEVAATVVMVVGCVVGSRLADIEGAAGAFLLAAVVACAASSFQILRSPDAPVDGDLLHPANN